MSEPVIDFEKLVADAIDNVPSPYKEKINNVNFAVEDEPTAEQRHELGLRPCDALFGLYQGVPLPKRGGAVHSLVPDVITVFKKPMIYMFPEDEALRRQVFKTVWHEVAHYFGLNHDQIYKAELGL